MLTKLLLDLISLPSPQLALRKTFQQRLFLLANLQLRRPMDRLPFALLVCRIYQTVVATPGSRRKGQGRAILVHWYGLHGADDCNDGNGCFQ